MKTLVRTLIFVVLTWFFIMLIGGLQQAVGTIPAEFGLPQLAPGFAALLMLVLFPRDKRRLNFAGGGLSGIRWIAVFALPLVLGLAVFALARLFGISPAAGPGYRSALLALIWMPVGAIGEEIGWRGYLQPLLAEGIPGSASALIVGLLWAPIHVYFFANGTAFMVLFFLLIVAYSVVMYKMTSGAGFPVLAAALFHLGINLSSFVSADFLNSTTFMALLAGVWCAAAVVALALNRSGGKSST